MAKELIVSVNGREKKIAIIENEKVTEFYIERGEGNQGIVGNIYKGRVMRVLPGMQSAFVDIGLERDAFLYVSDFMELEDQDELDEVPTDRAAPAPEPRHQQQPDEAHLALSEAHSTTSSEVESQPQAEEAWRRRVQYRVHDDV